MKKFAILGYGTVGKAVAEVWDELPEKPLAQGPILVRHAYPADRFSAYLTEDFSVIENDPEVAVVAEVIGGTDDAYTYSKRALLAGKSVVSSNKALVAAHGAELFALAKKMGVSYRFEAAVAGGIPLLAPLTESLKSNRVTELCGILNGTTNYILTAMKSEGAAYGDALKKAQELGFAEADPTADVEGHDAGRKTAILASLAFGKNVRYEDLSVQGITQITPADLELADALGCAVKLIGHTGCTEQGVYAFVEPHLVPRDKLLSAVNGVMNACMVRCSAANELMFYGPGAGGRPTASAVCSDLLAAAKHAGDCMELSDEPVTLLDADELPSRWYVRCKAEPDALLAAFPTARPVYGTSGEAGFITELCAKSALTGALQAVNAACAWRVLD